MGDPTCWAYQLGLNTMTSVVHLFHIYARDLNLDFLKKPALMLVYSALQFYMYWIFLVSFSSCPL